MLLTFCIVANSNNKNKSININKSTVNLAEKFGHLEKKICKKNMQKKKQQHKTLKCMSVEKTHKK